MCDYSLPPLSTACQVGDKLETHHFQILALEGVAAGGMPKAGFVFFQERKTRLLPER